MIECASKPCFVDCLGSASYYRVGRLLYHHHETGGDFDDDNNKETKIATTLSHKVDEKWDDGTSGR